jgi:radical SAM protein with 4Fe4S-binding SPASM domain
MTAKKSIVPIDRDAHDRMFRRFRRTRFPFQGAIELTRRCNLRCPYCYIPPTRQTDGEMETGMILSLIDQAAAAGCLFLTLTGGEPLLREDFPAIHRRALERGIMVALFTNGTLIDRRLARFFRDYPPFCVDITLPGDSRETYERISGLPGSWMRSRRAIRLLREYGVPFRLKTVVSTLNAHELGRIQAYARRIGSVHRFDSLICRRLDGAAVPSRYRLSPEETVGLDRADGEKWEEFSDYVCRQAAVPSSRRLYRCGGGSHSFHITAQGSLTLCALETRHAYDLNRGSFREGWETFIPRVRSIESSPGNPCVSCGMIAVCGNCPAWSTLETGSPEAAPDYRCQVARRRCTLLDVNGRKNHACGKEKAKVSPA